MKRERNYWFRFHWRIFNDGVCILDLERKEITVKWRKRKVDTK